MPRIKGRNAIGTEVPPNGTCSVGGYLFKNHSAKGVVIQQDAIGLYVRSKDGTVSVRMKKKEKSR